MQYFIQVCDLKSSLANSLTYKIVNGNNYIRDLITDFGTYIIVPYQSYYFNFSQSVDNINNFSWDTFPSIIFAYHNSDTTYGYRYYSYANNVNEGQGISYSNFKAVINSGIIFKTSN